MSWFIRQRTEVFGCNELASYCIEVCESKCRSAFIAETISDIEDFNEWLDDIGGEYDERLGGKRRTDNYYIFNKSFKDSEKAYKVAEQLQDELHKQFPIKGRRKVDFDYQDYKLNNFEWINPENYEVVPVAFKVA